jgi:phosphatidyl-myo-inositol dimannoside synthase
MKTLLVTIEYPPFFGGVANYYSNLVKYWPEGADLCGEDGIMVLDNKFGELISDALPFYKWLPGVLKIYQTIKKQKIDHIIVGHILPLGTAVWMATRFTKTPYTIVLHGMDLLSAMQVPRKKKLAEKILMGAKNIICTNSYIEKITQEFVPDKKDAVHMINPGIENIKFPDYATSIEARKKLGQNDNLVIFTLSRLVKRKGMDKIIAAMPEIIQAVPRARYVIAGRGPDEAYLRALAEKLPEEAREKIIFIINIGDEEKWEWMRSCDIFAMPARAMGADIEGFGIVYMEAALAGKPVIAGNSGGVGDAVVHNETGLMVDPENVDDITKALARLLLDENLRKKLGEQGRARALRDFRWKDKVEKIYRIIKSHPN